MLNDEKFYQSIKNDEQLREQYLQEVNEDIVKVRNKIINLQIAIKNGSKQNQGLEDELEWKKLFLSSLIEEHEYVVNLTKEQEPSNE